MPLITQLPEVGTGKSRSPTSNILLRSMDTRNYATENCVWSFEAKLSIDIEQT